MFQELDVPGFKEQLQLARSGSKTRQRELSCADSDISVIWTFCIHGQVNNKLIAKFMGNLDQSYIGFSGLVSQLISLRVCEKEVKIRFKYYKEGLCLLPSWA